MHRKTKSDIDGSSARSIRCAGHCLWHVPHRSDLATLRFICHRSYSTEGRGRRVVAVTEAELLAASAGTWLIRPALIVLSRGQSHHVGRRPALLEQLPHGPHRRARVFEAQPQARTKVVLARFAVAREYEPVLRTSAVA